MDMNLVRQINREADEAMAKARLIIATVKTRLEMIVDLTKLVHDSSGLLEFQTDDDFDWEEPPVRVVNMTRDDDFIVVPTSVGLVSYQAAMAILMAAP